MRAYLNTLYITTDGAWLRKEGENIVMEVDGQQKARLPLHMLQGLVCIGRVLASPQLMGYCAERGICISYLTPNGKFLARVEGPVSGNVLLRREQYRRTEQAKPCAAIVRNMLIGKIFNQRTVIARAVRDHASTMPVAHVEALKETMLRLKRIINQVEVNEDVDAMRGMEGDAAQQYFAVFNHLIRSPSPFMQFHGRSRRPPKDAVNALLSLLYTLLTHDCRSALETVGLDPAVGFLHKDRPGRASLALDLMEEFRPVLADRLTLSLINRKQVTERDFQTMDNGAVLLKDDARKLVLTAWQEKKREMLLHNFTGETTPIGQFPFIQAQLLARHLRGDIDGYAPFIWK